MSELDSALDRLGEAVTRLLDAAQRGRISSGDANVIEAEVAEIIAERDRLRAEIAELRAAREEDAKLRAEAAEAVRDALRDLRLLLAAQERAQGELVEGGANG